jgi:hypothetical protein
VGQRSMSSSSRPLTSCPQCSLKTPAGKAAVVLRDCQGIAGRWELLLALSSVPLPGGNTLHPSTIPIVDLPVGQ